TPWRASRNSFCTTVLCASGQYTARLSAQKSTMSPSRNIVLHSYCLRKESRRSAWHEREPRWMSERNSARIRFNVRPEVVVASSGLWLAGRLGQRCFRNMTPAGCGKKNARPRTGVEGGVMLSLEERRRAGYRRFPTTKLQGRSGDPAQIGGAGVVS